MYIILQAFLCSCDILPALVSSLWVLMARSGQVCLQSAALQNAMFMAFLGFCAALCGFWVIVLFRQSSSFTEMLDLIYSCLVLFNSFMQAGVVLFLFPACVHLLLVLLLLFTFFLLVSTAVTIFSGIASRNWSQTCQLFLHWKLLQ